MEKTLSNIMVVNFKKHDNIQNNLPYITGKRTFSANIIIQNTSIIL